MNYTTPTEWKSEAWWRNRPLDERIHHLHIPERIRDAMDKREPVTLKGDGNLFIQAPNGAGKSLVAARTLVHAVSTHQISGRWVEAGDYVDMIKESFDNNGLLPEMYSTPHLVKYIKGVFDVVVIDGLGEEWVTDFANNELGNLIRKRYDQKKATIITSRFSLQDIKNRYGTRLATPLADFPMEVIGGKR